MSQINRCIVCSTIPHVHIRKHPRTPTRIYTCFPNPCHYIYLSIYLFIYLSICFTNTSKHNHKTYRFELALLPLVRARALSLPHTHAQTYTNKSYSMHTYYLYKVTLGSSAEIEIRLFRGLTVTKHRHWIEVIKGIRQKSYKTSGLLRQADVRPEFMWHCIVTTVRLYTCYHRIISFISDRLTRTSNYSNTRSDLINDRPSNTMAAWLGYNSVTALRWPSKGKSSRRVKDIRTTTKCLHLWYVYCNLIYLLLHDIPLITIFTIYIFIFHVSSI